MFQIVAVNFDAYQSLPCAKSRWLLTCLVRYCNKAGEAFPSLRQLGRDAGISEASACRWMQKLDACGVFEERRRRSGNGRFFYRIAERFRPRLPAKQPAKNPSCMAAQAGLAPTRKAISNPTKQERRAAAPRFAGFKDSQNGLLDMTEQWRARVRSFRQSGFWLMEWGEKPGRPGSLVPASVLAGLSSLPAG